eukprot:5909721-Prymnesium_polylepis.1
MRDAALASKRGMRGFPSVEVGPDASDIVSRPAPRLGGRPTSRSPQSPCDKKKRRRHIEKLSSDGRFSIAAHVP